MLLSKYDRCDVQEKELRYACNILRPSCTHSNVLDVSEISKTRSASIRMENYMKRDPVK